MIALLEAAADTTRVLLDWVLPQTESLVQETKRVSGKMVGKALETVCAFANTKGGWLFLGIEDANKAQGRDRLYGIAENAEAVDELLRKLGTHHLPVVEGIVGYRLHTQLRDGTEGVVVALHVPPSDKVHSILDAGTWMRGQSSNREMSAQEITELSYRRGVRSAESEPVDVDFELLESETWRLFLRGRGLATTGIADQLFRIGLAKKVGGQLRPLRAAVLLFADHPGALLLQPQPMKTIADPACGTGGFFLGAYDWLTKKSGKNLNLRQLEFLHSQTFHGNEIVASTRRLCLMNLFLHNVGELDGEPAVDRADALISAPEKRFDYVLANPPFGKKSSMTITNAEGEEDRDALTYERQDFWQTTSNKQLNFLQHIVTILKTTGQAAVVLPDNVLFEGGAGEKIRRKLLETCDVHTLLRLPTGIFYAQGVKANVLFFDKKPADGKVHTQGVWIYDLRTNKHFTLKTRPLASDDLRDFIDCYHPANRQVRKASERFRYFGYEELVTRDKASLDIFWLKDDSLDNLDDLPPPDVLQQEIIEHLEAALASFRDVAAGLPRP